MLSTRIRLKKKLSNLLTISKEKKRKIIGTYFYNVEPMTLPPLLKYSTNILNSYI